MDALYRKSLRVSSAAKGDMGAGKIQNLQSNDAGEAEALFVKRIEALRLIGGKVGHAEGDLGAGKVRNLPPDDAAEHFSGDLHCRRTGAGVQLQAEPQHALRLTCSKLPLIVQPSCGCCPPTCIW